MKALRRINTIDTWGGITEDDSILTHAVESIFIAKDEHNHYGMVTWDHSDFLPFRYDSITPLGFNLWQLCKNGKFGVISLKYDKEMKLAIEWRLPCEYDYLSAENGNIVCASKYSPDSDKDEKDIFFVHIDEKMEGGCYDRISWDYYYVCSNIDGERKFFLINARNGKKHYFDRDYVLIGNQFSEDNEHYLMFEDTYPSSEKGLIVRISKDGEITESDLYDDVPIAIFTVDTNGMDESVPIAYIGKKRGQYYYIDSSLEEYAHPFENMCVETVLSGKTIDGDEKNKSISRFYIRAQATKVTDARIRDDYDNDTDLDEDVPF